MNIPKPQLERTYDRWMQRSRYRQRNLDLIHKKSFFKADSPERVEKFLARRGFSPGEQKEIINSAEQGIPLLGHAKNEVDESLRLERIMGSNDLVGIPFLIRGLSISRTVGRLWICDNLGKICGYGTGFMISPTLLMTNHHVLPDPGTAQSSFIEFNYEMGEKNNLLISEVFRINPTVFYYSDENLDYAIAAVEDKSRNGALLGQYGWNRLLKEEGKAIISQWLNIIEHPNGEPKQIGLRENQLIDVFDEFLHYRTDTAPGSSGSPVYNERWEVVALHHSGIWDTDENGDILSIDGKKWTEEMGEENIKWIANEGARISSIINHMLARNLTGSQLQLFDQVFSAIPEITPLTTAGNTNKSGAPLTLHAEAAGSFSCTFPITVSVKIGGQESELKITPHAPTATGTTPDIPLTSGGASSEKEILQKAREAFLKRPDVLEVRMGYVFENGWITKRRAIVVTVEKRKTVNELRTENNSPLPNRFMGMPVEISAPTIGQLLQRKVGSGPLEAFIARRPAFALETRYFPPAGTPLKKVTARMKVVAHVSPEEGWNNLRPFLSDTNDSLSIAMYDFGAPHIVNTIKDLHHKSSFQHLILTLQKGESLSGGIKKDDLKDEDVVEEFERTFKNNFKNAWVNIGAVDGWVSSSYHIKVAVRDGHAFHLSSGNYQSTNQPDLSSLDNPSQGSLLRTYNREWHAIVEHEELSRTFERFIEHDFTNNKKIHDEEAFRLDDVLFLYPASATVQAEERTIKYEAFKPFVAERQFTVAPLLTPDNYFDEVKALIESAEEELYIQNQTFNAPRDGQDNLRELVEAVLQKQRQGVDVKIIFRAYIPAAARKNLEALADMGFDMKSFKTYAHCHTKGIIVDNKKVLLGSQNWSNDGVSVNRDASLLFEDKELAAYFRKIFLHDWKKLSRQDIGRESFSLEIAPAGGKIPPGMKVLSLKEIREIL